MQVTLSQLAYARSGDKGDGSNVGVVAYNADCYEIIKAALTPARVKEHFREICFGDVDRYEAPNLLALNFILHDSLGGGGSESVDGDSLDQRWRDMEGQARSRLPTSHLGSGDSINRIMSQEVAQPRARAHAV